VDEELIVELAKRERQMQPRLGGRKLMHLLEGDLKEAGVEIGRDRFLRCWHGTTCWWFPSTADLGRRTAGIRCLCLAICCEAKK
jgi:hypothetical protein